MNKLSEKDLLVLHQETVLAMYGPYARVTDDEWNHALGVVINLLVLLEQMGFVDLTGFDFGEKNGTL